MAAQEAIKEQYTLPWAARQAADRVSAGDSSTPAPSPSPSKPAKSPIDIPVTPEAEAEAVPEQPQVVPSKPAPVQDASGTDQPTVTRVLLAEGGELPSLSSLPDVHEAPTAAQLVPSATAPKSHPPSDQAAPLTPPETTNANPADSDSSSPPSSPSGPSTPLSTEPKLRVLTKAHFEYALKNSSSSGSEELGALPELRKVRDFKYGFRVLLSMAHPPIFCPLRYLSGTSSLETRVRRRTSAVALERASVSESAKRRSRCS